MRATKISSGKYKYRGFLVEKFGYHHPDQCIVWEGVHLESGYSLARATTKRKVMSDIDYIIDVEKTIN